MREFSYQLYSSRNFPPLEDTLRMVANAGYCQVEGYGALFTDLGAANALRAAMDDTGLTMPTAHFGLDLVTERASDAVALARTLGLKAVFVPFVQPQQRPSDSAGWAAFGSTLAEASKPFLDAGLKFGWRNHEFECAALPSGEMPMDLIMQGSDDLMVELDIAWVQVGGQIPFRWIEKYKDRILSAHIKDIAPSGECQDEDGWADVGYGVMDWPGLFRALDQTTVEYFVMEHDNPSDDTRFAKRSIDTCKGLEVPA